MWLWLWMWVTKSMAKSMVEVIDMTMTMVYGYVSDQGYGVWFSALWGMALTKAMSMALTQGYGHDFYYD